MLIQQEAVNNNKKKKKKSNRSRRSGWTRVPVTGEVLAFVGLLKDVCWCRRFLLRSPLWPLPVVLLGLPVNNRTSRRKWHDAARLPVSFSEPFLCESIQQDLEPNPVCLSVLSGPRGYERAPSCVCTCLHVLLFPFSWCVCSPAAGWQMTWTSRRCWRLLIGR